MANTRVALAKGFSVAVVVVFLAIGGYVLLAPDEFTRQGQLVYLLTLSFALTGARGIWAERYKVGTIGAVGMLVAAALQSALVVGLALLLGVALVLAYSGRKRGQLE